MRPPSLFISGIGAWLPPRLSAQEAVDRGWYEAASMELDGWASVSVAGDLAPAEMALHAARDAIARTGQDASQIDIVLHASIGLQGPHGWFPQSYIERHAVGRSVPSLELRQGCTALFAAFELMSAYLAVPGRKGALFTCADNFGVDPAVGPDPTMRWRYALNGQTGRGSVLGDAGAAVVLSGHGGFAQVLSVSSRAQPEMEALYRGGEPLFPPNYDKARPLRLGERFSAHEQQHPGALFSMLKQLNAARIEVAREAMDEAGVGPDRIARVVHVFSGTERYVTQFLKPLGINAARGIVEFGRTLGHLAACDPVVGLEHLVDTGQVVQGDHVLVMASGGAATSVSCAVLAMVETPRWLS